MSCRQLKILWPVVIPNVVQMVYLLVGFQRASNFLFHHKDVLQHVAVLPSPRMAGTPNKDVALSRLHVASSLP